MKKTITIALLSTALISGLSGQISHESSIFQSLKTQDSLMFSVGFNNCNIDQMEKLVFDDLEFYHDKGGVTKSKSTFINAFKTNLCGTGTNTSQRRLDENSLQVFPLYEGDEIYGAIQKGVHYFGNTKARFTHLWLLSNEEWKLSRVFSYDHHQEEVSIDSNVDFINLTKKELLIYQGNYKFSPEFTLSIIVEENKIYGEAQGQKVEIKPYGNHKFLDANKQMQLVFNINDIGTVTGLSMTGPNGQMHANKILKH